MRKYIKALFFSLAIILILSVGLISFFISTTPGLYALIKLSQFYIPGHIKIHGLKGRLIDHFSINELEYFQQNTNDQFKIKNLTVNWHLDSLLSPQITISQFSADEIQRSKNSPLYTLKNIKLTGLINTKIIKVHSISVTHLDHLIAGHMQLSTEFPHKLKAAFTLNTITKKEHKSPLIIAGTLGENLGLQAQKGVTTGIKNQNLRGTLTIGGDFNLVHWTGAIHGPGTIALDGTLEQLSHLEQVIKWRDIEWPLFSNKKLISPEGRIKCFGTLPQMNIQLNSKLNKTAQEQWQLIASAQGTIPWQWDFNANLTPSSSLIEGLYTQIAVKGSLKSGQQGNFLVRINPGHYQLPKDSGLSKLDFQGGAIKATLSPKQLEGTGSIRIDEHKRLDLSLKLPQFNLTNGITGKQPISSNLSLVFDSLDFLQTLSPELKNPRGHLLALLKTSGTIEKSHSESKVILNQAGVELPAFGLNLSAIDLTITSKEQKWEGTGSISSGKSKITLLGKGSLSPEFQGECSLQGSDVPLINSDEYHINISPQLKIAYKKLLLSISGRILVPEALIKINSFSNSVNLSEDVVFKTKDKEPAPTPFHTQLDVQVEMGNAVELSAKGLHATLSGIVNLTQQPKGPISAIGELNVIKGTYKAYGQNLEIEHGELIFTGGGLDNPGINLRAAKKIDTSSATLASTNQLLNFNNNNVQSANVQGNINVGVEVTGRLTAPKIQLFSNPSVLSQADILSMLVLGRPANQANKAGGQLLLAALSSMDLGNSTKSTQLLEQLKQSLGVDFDVQTNSNYNLLTNTVNDNTAFVVSKPLSKRISVSYNVGLSQANPNVLILKYLLNKFFSIQVSSSTTSNGIDVLYTANKK